jgi:hypothetical protein
MLPLPIIHKNTLGLSCEKRELENNLIQLCTSSMTSVLTKATLCQLKLYNSVTRGQLRFRQKKAAKYFQDKLLGMTPLAGVRNQPTFHRQPQALSLGF